MVTFVTTRTHCCLVLCILISCIHHNHADGANKVHKCSSHHHKIIKGVNLFQQQVAYKSHPYDQPQKSSPPKQELPDKRSLLSQHEVSPIRVSAYYDPLTFDNTLSAEHQKYVKQLIGAVTAYYEKAVSVIPVDGPLLIDRVCTNYWDTSHGKVCFRYHPSKCFDTNIPPAHLSKQYIFDDSGSRTLLPGGSGISNTDLLLYISANFSSQNCGSQTLAAGGPCIQDQYGRPIAGNINICSHLFETMVWKSDVNTLLHEMTHVTVQIKSLWSDFRDASGNKIAMDQVVDTTVSPAQIITPTVVSKVRQHFNCPSATGLPLDVAGTSHWNQQYVFSEVMNPYTLSPQHYYSEFTLALMQDSGWYAVNYQYAEPYAFGKNAGCAFLTDDCINKETHMSRFPQYFCHSSADAGCNADHSVASYCYYKNEHESIPTESQYFADPHEGGADFSNFCPWRSPYSNKAVCWDLSAYLNGNTFDSSYREMLSTARCTAIKDTSNGWNHGHCFAHKCYGWNGTNYKGAMIQYSSTESVKCARSDTRSTKTLSSVTNRELVCPDIDNVCGTSSNFGSCFWGHYSDIEGKCVCSAAYTGTKCNERNDAVYDITHTTAHVVTESTFSIVSSVCLEDWNDYNPGFNGAWSKTSTYYDLGVYENGKYVMYFRASTASWVIASEIGDSMYCHCSISLYTEDIDKCSGNWCCYTGEMTNYPNLKTYYGECTKTSLRSAQKGSEKKNVSKVYVVGVILGCMLCVVLIVGIAWCCVTLRKSTKLMQESALLSEQSMDDHKGDASDTQQIYIPPSEDSI